MSILLWIFAGIVAIAFAYSMRFTQATLSFGRHLAGTTSGTGLQDAITPPWQTNLSMFSYIGVAVAIGAIWWQLGWGPGLGAVVFILVGGGVVGAMLPEKDSPHFTQLIQRSMIARYANYARDGDTMRAQAMKELLIRADIERGEPSTGA